MRRAAAATVILIHGGREVGTRPVRRFDLPLVRIELFRLAIRGKLRRRGIAVRRLRFSQQGWNHDGASAIADLRALVEELAVGSGANVVLVGHSMGGRTAIRLIDHPTVAGVVGLAPWLPLGEPMGDVAGRWLLIAHGDSDRTTYPQASFDFVQRALSAGACARHVVVPGEGHALMNHPRWWNRYIIDSVVEILS
ncbi:MAG: alpha/beta fold hydrolase [Actinomycetia bacterium]|nr:alpha/beta fold hydrolase [Actinomycetes bacterium]